MKARAYIPKGESPRAGYGLVEVVVALGLVTIFLLGVTRMYIHITRNGGFAEEMTYAAILGDAKLSRLQTLPFVAAELDPNWHRDPENPLTQQGRQYLRFWSVNQSSAGREVTVYVAWGTGLDEAACVSGEALTRSGCAHLTLKAHIVSP